MTPKLDKNKILETIAQNKDSIRQFGITKLGLFGSYARDEQTDHSDIDFIVEFNKNQKNIRNFLGFIDFSENIFNKKVDLVTFDSTQKILYKYIKDDIRYAQI